MERESILNSSTVAGKVDGPTITLVTPVTEDNILGSCNPGCIPLTPGPCQPNTGWCQPRVLCRPQTEGCFPSSPCIPNSLDPRPIPGTPIPPYPPKPVG